MINPMIVKNFILCINELSHLLLLLCNKLFSHKARAYLQENCFEQESCMYVFMVDGPQKAGTNFIFIG